MGTNTIDTGLYEREKGMYLKILIGLLVLTALTFVQPHLFMKDATFGVQLAIAGAKAWLIVAYYMHLKSEKSVLGLMVLFAMVLVLFFFTTTMIDVSHFQFADESYITTGTK